MKLPIYLDHHATTPVDSEVLKAMLPFFTDFFGNPSSQNHAFGKVAAEAVHSARETIKGLLNAEFPEEIVFTSGATESNNLAIKGIAERYQGLGKHIITTSIEHRSVFSTCESLEKKGFRITYLAVNKDGRINLSELEEAICDETILISIIAANNEVGVLQDLEKIGRIAKQKQVFFHTDATQAIGRIKIDVQAMGIDLLSFSAHKIYGPKGCGALYLRKKNPRTRLYPLLHGGGQERNFRSGSLNTPGIVGLAKACELLERRYIEENDRFKSLRDRLWNGLKANLDEIYLNGSSEFRLVNNLNISFAYVEGESLINELAEEIAISSGSACMSAALEPSYVLKALEVREDLAHTSIRFGIGRTNTEEEIDYTVEKITQIVKRMRLESPIYALALSEKE